MIRPLDPEAREAGSSGIAVWSMLARSANVSRRLDRCIKSVITHTTNVATALKSKVSRSKIIQSSA